MFLEHVRSLGPNQTKHLISQPQVLGLCVHGTESKKLFMSAPRGIKGFSKIGTGIG
jgi:hypothetical protein